MLVAGLLPGRVPSDGSEAPALLLCDALLCASALAMNVFSEVKSPSDVIFFSDHSP
jgi:hypothetical protein